MVETAIQAPVPFILEIAEKEAGTMIADAQRGTSGQESLPQPVGE